MLTVPASSPKQSEAAFDGGWHFSLAALARHLLAVEDAEIAMKSNEPEYRSNVADQQRRADAATLDNVRICCQRTADAWLAMADKDALRAKRIAERSLGSSLSTSA